jgi:hypothetical protein
MCLTPIELTDGTHLEGTDPADRCLAVNPDGGTRRQGA